MFIFPLPGAERKVAYSTLTSSSILTNTLSIHQNKYESPPIADCQEEKISLLQFQGYGRRWYLLSQKYFALLYVEKWKFNTYRKNGCVNSIVSRMVHYPAAIRVIFLKPSHISPSKSEKMLRKRTTDILMLYQQFIMRIFIKHDPFQRSTKTKSWKILKETSECIHRCFANQ